MKTIHSIARPVSTKKERRFRLVGKISNIGIVPYVGPIFLQDKYLEDC